MHQYEIKLTGLNFIPGRSEKRLEEDHLERYRFVVPRVKGLKGLDIACGPGYGTRMLAEAGAEMVGADLSPEILGYAREHYSHPRVRYYEGNIAHFREGAPFDFVTCFETIEHLRPYREALANLHAVLKPGGTLYISSPNRPVTTPEARSLADAPRNIHHTQEFTPSEMLGFLREAGFLAGEDDVYGQRLQRVFRSALLRKLYRMAFRPEERTSPLLSRPGRLAPRYFFIEARKPA
ncbi:MAG TPA: class I SAM-dependent methyltransferase [Fibrobacteria bacterium]|nr:class I SAM-dependent methyltransferase [Fibrobacteria bacterium]